MATLILLPGLACDASLWRDPLRALAPRYAPVVSDVHERFDAIDAMADALLAEHAGALVLIGASMGGMIALAAASRSGERVRGLALLGSTARADTPEMRTLRSQAIGLFEQGRMDEVLRANLPFAFHPGVRGDSEIVARYLASVRRAGALQLIRQNRAVLARADARAGLAAIRCPTLVVCGDADQLTPPECSQEIAAGIAAARLAIVPDCGHMLTLEQPEQVNALLLEWLATLG